MSEYQYYEFRAIDRPLTEKEQDYIDSLSSRVDLTPTKAIFTYSYSDFPADAEKVLEKYFDAMLYMANWGTTRLMFRLPPGVVDQEAISAYCLPDAVSIRVTKSHVILDITVDEEEGGDWIEGEGWLSRLVPLRDELMRGDFRLLYLAWLRGIQPFRGLEEDDEAYGYTEISPDQLEPPVPAGLNKLTAALKCFVKLFELDEDLIAVAAETSSIVEAEPEIEKLIPKLSEQERADFLLRLARGEPNVGAQLSRRLKEVSAQGKAAIKREDDNRRTVSDLLKTADEQEKRERERKRQAAERARIRKLDSLAPKEPELWEQVFALIAQKQTKAYEEAIKILVDLRNLAAHLGRSDSFQSRINQIHKDYNKLSGLLSRMRSAGLKKS